MAPMWSFIWIPTHILCSWVYLQCDSSITAVVSCVYGQLYNHTCVLSMTFVSWLLLVKHRSIFSFMKSPRLSLSLFFLVIHLVNSPVATSLAHLNNCHWGGFYASHWSSSAGRCPSSPSNLFLQVFITALMTFYSTFSNFESLVRRAEYWGSFSWCL